MSVIGPVQSHCHEGSPVGKRSLRWKGFVENVGFEHSDRSLVLPLFQQHRTMVHVSAQFSIHLMSSIAKAGLCDQCGLSVTCSVCHSLILSVSRITAKLIRRPFHWNLALWLGLRFGRTLVVIRSRIRFRITFPCTSLTIAEYWHCRFISISHTVTGRFSRYSAIDWRWHDNECTTFLERSGRHPDLKPDYPGNPDSNRRALLVEILASAEVLRVQCNCFWCSHYVALAEFDWFSPRL